MFDIASTLPVSRANWLIGKLPKQSPASSNPQTITANPPTESQTQIQEKPNTSEVGQGEATSTTGVSECGNVRLDEYEYFAKTSEENQLCILQQPLLLDARGITDDTNTLETDTKNTASMIESINVIVNPNSCVPSVGDSALSNSDTFIKSPPRLDSENGTSMESEEQVDELSVDIVSEGCSEKLVVTDKILIAEDLNGCPALTDSGEIPVTQAVKPRDGDIEPEETQHEPGTPLLVFESQIAAMSTSVADGETIIEVQRYLKDPILELCRPPISPISPAVKEKASQPLSMVKPTGASDLTDVCNNSPSQVVDLSNQVQTTANIPLINDTPTKVNDQDSPDEEDRTTQFDDDKERLKSFLLRTQASKANKQTSITRRESLQNRRDSDVIRKALASPRPVLEEKDANTSSPAKVPSLHELSKQLESVINDVEDRDVTTRVENHPVAEGIQDTSSSSPTLRRSTRKQSRIPQLPNASTAARTPKKINVRRTDGNETLVLAAKKEAQEFAQLTRTNTRKNKVGAIPALQRLVQLTAESLTLDTDTQQPSQDSVNTQENNEKDKKRGVQWDEKLTYFKAAPVSNPSPTTSYESGNRTQPTQSLAPPQPKKTSTNRVRRLRGLGGANGTPAKGLLAATLLPDEVAEQKEEEAAAAGENERLTRPQKAALGKNHWDKKRRLATPKKLELKPSVASVNGGIIEEQVEGKENVTRLRVVSPRKGSIVSGKMMIPVTATGTGKGTGTRTGDGGIGPMPTRKRAARKI